MPAPIGGFINCTQPLANCQDLITDNANTSDDADFISADDFRPAADGVILSVCWWGVYLPDPVANAFTVTFYLDIGGLPGPIVGGPFVEGFTLMGVTQRDTGLLVAGAAPIFEYTASLGAPFAVSASACYWIEVKNALPDQTTWFWQQSNGGNNQFAQDGTPPDGYDASDLVVGNDLAWCISLPLGDPFTCIPPCTPGGVANNCCADRTEIFNGQTDFSTVGASTDGPGEPDCTGGGGPVNDIWFNYTATFTGDLTVTTCEELNGSADFDTVLVVYDGCACDPLSPLLGCNDDDAVNACGTGGGGFHSTTVVPVTAGNCYKIRLGGFSGGEAGTGTLSLNKDAAPPQPPDNDDCENGQSIINGKTEFTSSNATTDGPPEPVCTAGPGPVNDIWYNYTADFTGDLTVTTCEELNGSADFDTMLAVYDGCACAPLSPLLGCNDDDPDNACGTGGGGFHSTVAVPVTAGNCYKIRLGGFSGGSAGSGTLNLSTEVPEPCTPGGVANNCCPDRTPIFNGETAFSTLGATTDGPVHLECEFDGQTYQDIWFNYTSDFTGDVTVSTCDRADYDTDLVVYDGCDCAALNLLACNDDMPGCAGFTSEVVVPVVAGNCYKIRVGGFQGGDEGTGTVNITKACEAPIVECFADLVDDDDSSSNFDDCELVVSWIAFSPTGCEIEVVAVIDIGCAVIPVENGQIVDLECVLLDDDGSSLGRGRGDDDSSSEECGFHFENDGTLEIESDVAVLVVTVTDENGNVASCETHLCGMCPDDDDDSSSDDDSSDADDDSSDADDDSSDADDDS